MRLFTVRQVAEKLNVCEATVRAMAADGRLPAIRLLSRKLLFAEAIVERALERAQSVPADTPPTAA